MATDADGNMTEANRRAWNAQRYDAWTSAFGSPETEAARIVAEPERLLRRLIPYLGDVRGKRICNVQGSHGRIAVALARLGSNVQVIDFSEENRRYALSLAEAAGVKIDYTVCDIMEAGDLGLARSFDVLLLELGILHYHQDINRFFTVMHGLAADGGTLFLNEFHPVQRKLFWTEGPRDYFQTALIEADVPNPDIAGAGLGRCLYRFWTMGDILTAVIDAGFAITRLDEHPDWTDPTLPGSFTLLARA
jgi:2-polyprenyl-3-methyl-5-hydroxy-6-metoxy-1,4-benzoquinol methylase